MTATGTAIAVTTARFLAARDQLIEVHRAVFCAPPWNEPAARADAFADRLPADTARPGFAAAWLRDGDGLAGFGYGYTTAWPFPDHGCYATMRKAFGDGVEQLSGTLEVVELAKRYWRR